MGLYQVKFQFHHVIAEKTIEIAGGRSWDRQSVYRSNYCIDSTLNVTLRPTSQFEWLHGEACFFFAEQAGQLLRDADYLSTGNSCQGCKKSSLNSVFHVPLMPFHTCNTWSVWHHNPRTYTGAHIGTYVIPDLLLCKPKTLTVSVSFNVKLG